MDPAAYAERSPSKRPDPARLALFRRRCTSDETEEHKRAARRHEHRFTWVQTAAQFDPAFRTDRTCYFFRIAQETLIGRNAGQEGSNVAHPLTPRPNRRKPHNVADPRP